MSTDVDKHDALGAVETKEHHDTERFSLQHAEDEDGKVTLKTKLAVLSLIFMYEAYLFTLLMSVAPSFLGYRELTLLGQLLSLHISTQISVPIPGIPG